MSRALRHPGFRRLFTGLATSSLGDAVMLLVLSMWVKDLTGSNARAGLTFLFMLLPSLAAPALASSSTGCRASRCWCGATCSRRWWCCRWCWCAAPTTSG